MYADPQEEVIVRFGVFELDLRSAELRKSGVRVKLQELPGRALRAFLARPDDILTRDDLRRALWPDDVFVDFDHGISTVINRLRETLGDSAGNPRFIETVARTGYRWIAPVQVLSRNDETVAKVLNHGGSALPMEAAPAVIASRDNSSWKRWRASAALIAMGAAVVLGLGITRSYRSAGLSSSKSAAPSATPAKMASTSHDPQAEELYLKGRYYWSKRTPDGLRQAVDYFTQAIVRDPGYANAYVGLADSYNLMREFASMPDAEAYPRGYAAASKAVELDGSSAEAHATLGFVAFWWKHDIATADREFQRAIALDPNYVAAFHWYANVLGCEGRMAEDLSYLHRAEELDPASASIRADEGEALITAGRTEEGVALLKQMETTDPSFASPHLYLSQLYLSELDGPDYLAEARATARLRKNSDDLAVQGAAEKGYAAGGAAGMLGNMLEVQKKLYEQQRLEAYTLAQTEALLGEREAALRDLRTSVSREESLLSIMRIDPALSTLRSTPEFRQLLAQVGLPPLR